MQTPNTTCVECEMHRVRNASNGITRCTECVYDWPFDACRIWRLQSVRFQPAGTSYCDRSNFAHDAIARIGWRGGAFHCQSGAVGVRLRTAHIPVLPFRQRSELIQSFHDTQKSQIATSDHLKHRNNTAKIFLHSVNGKVLRFENFTIWFLLNNCKWWTSGSHTNVISRLLGEELLQN